MCVNSVAFPIARVSSGKNELRRIGKAVAVWFAALLAVAAIASRALGQEAASASATRALSMPDKIHPKGGEMRVDIPGIEDILDVVFPFGPKLTWGKEKPANGSGSKLVVTLPALSPGNYEIRVAVSEPAGPPVCHKEPLTPVDFLFPPLLIYNAVKPAHCERPPSRQVVIVIKFNVQAPAPVINAVSPNVGPVAGGTRVTITGTNLLDTKEVRFGDSGAMGIVVVDDSTVTAITPPHAKGKVDVAVASTGGKAVGRGLFAYVDKPAVTSVTPNSGPVTGGTNVVIAGTGFTDASAVSIGGVPAAGYRVENDATITAITPPHAAGSVDVAVTTLGGTGTGARLFTYVMPTTTTRVSSTPNPSEVRQVVTLTATVSSGNGTPDGTVTFRDGAAVLGTSTLTDGAARLTTSTLNLGVHNITASYAGNGIFKPSVSDALVHTVNVPQDSVKLRALQVAGSRLVAQNSGAAISGAVDSAIAEGFSDCNGDPVRMSGEGLRFNLTADPNCNRPVSRGAMVSAASGYSTSAAWTKPGSRFDEAFGGFGDRAQGAPHHKAYPMGNSGQERNWRLWADVRGTGVDRWGSSNPVSGTSQSSPLLYGSQVNALLGTSYLLTRNFLIGALGGYEIFTYQSEALNGRLRGDGWTGGSYLGWRLLQGLRFDAAVAFSTIQYDATSGVAQGTFSGRRTLASGGLTGTHKFYGVDLEPSVRVFALWERQNAYIDSLGTLQAERSFFTGRTSSGMKATVPQRFDNGLILSPYAGIYADYYFSDDDGAAIGTSGLPASALSGLQGWSARAIGGINANLADGATLGLGGELGGIGNSSYQLWSVKARAAVPF